MELEGPNSSGAAALAGGTSIQAELLALLEKFVHLIALGAMTDVQDLPEFRAIIGQLCEKAPEAARTLAAAILEYHSSEKTQRQPAQHEQDQEQESAAADPNDDKPVKRKKNPNKDPSYRPPKTTKTQSSNTGEPSGGGDTSTKDTGKTADANSGVGPSENETSFPSNQQQHGVQDNVVPARQDALTDRDKVEIAVDQDVTEIVETTDAISAPNRTKSQQTTVLQLVSETAPSTLPSTDMAPATPMKQMGAAPSSPQTEEIYRAKIPTSLESISSSPGSVTDPSSPEAAPLIDMIVEAVRIIHRFSKYPHAVPQEVHSRILQTLRNDNQEAIVASNLNQWSDGSVWIQVLEMGSAQNQKVTILNMLEYMGAWEWYDKQIELSQMTIRTKKNKPVDRKGAAIHVLNQMQSVQLSSERRGRWISGVGRVALTTEGDAGAPPPGDGDLGITERDKQAQRKRISMQLSRGQKLSTKLVKELGLGILFSSKIWEYTKKSGEQLDALIRGIKADSRRTKLLQILGPQLEQLVNNGHPDLWGLYDALNKEELVSQRELQELRATFALDSDTIPKGTLDTAVDRLIKHVSDKVLGKRKLEDVDSIAINNNVELSCSMFNKLRQDEWFDDWMIMAAMDISDKSFFIRHGKSIPLDDVGRTRTIKPYERPLATWARKITEFRQQARDRFGDSIRLVYFCPLNHRNNHFTLLEINEREEVIRHYDSMADQCTIDGTSQPTRVRRLVQVEFGDLKYAYSEAPTPQQNDGWSCGVRVVWNFRRLSNNLPIGAWDTSISPERMKMEIVEGLVACVEGSAMKKFKMESSTLSGDSKERLEEAGDEIRTD